MKKILCLVLALSMLCCFAACRKGSDSDSKKGEIDKYAKNGEIPEYGVKLGSSADSVIEYYNDLADKEDNQDLVLTQYEGNTAVNLMNGVQSFYYEKQHADKGVSVFAVTGGEAFGFELGNTTTKSDVLERLAAEYTETTAATEQLYFLPGTVDGAEVITCHFDKIRLEFFFFEDFLSAVCLTNTEYWTD